jgi:hypothetical protein
MISRKPKLQTPQVLLEKSLKKASELYGLRFDNKIDDLLGTGLKENTLTYLYGERISGIVNILALNSVRYFGGRALFVDAGNTADPYLIRQKADLKKKDFAETRRLLKSIDLTRVFTCHQLANFVIEQLPGLLHKNFLSENPIRFIGVAAFDSVFSEEDSPKTEIANLQHLIARKLRDIAKEKSNGVLYVVATSNKQSSHFIPNSDIVIDIYHPRRSDTERAALIRHPVMRGKEIELSSNK